MVNNACMLPEFSLFGNIALQHQVEKCFYQEFTPISLINDKAPITIVAQGAPNQCWALHKSFITVTCKIVKDDGAALAAGNDVTTCNNVLDSLFQQIDVELGDKQVSDNNILYGYRSIMDNLLSYSEEAQKTWMRGAIFAKDTVGQWEIYSKVDGSANLGAKE